MQSQISYYSKYRAPAAARFSALGSLIPSRPTLRPGTKRWTGPPRAFQKPVDSRGDFVRDKAYSRREVDPNLKIWSSKKLIDYGVLVDIGAGSIGLLHILNITHENIIPQDIEKMFSVGDKIKAMVHHINKERRRVILSTKSLEVNPGDMVKNPQLVHMTAEEVAAAFKAKADVDASLKVCPGCCALAVGQQAVTVHELRSGVVQAVKSYGVWVDIGASSFGLLYNNQISHQPVVPEETEKMFCVGGEIKVMVQKVHRGYQRINLITKSLEHSHGDMAKNPQLVYITAEEAAAAYRANVEALEQEKKDRKESRAREVDPNLKVHELRSGVVQDVKGYGGFVDIGSGSIGNLHISQISFDRISKEDLGKMFSVGDKIKVMVHRIDHDRHRISLSTKSLEVNPGDMVKNPQLVYEKAEEAAAAFRAKVAAGK
eukprot:gene26577-biopygen12939